MRNSFANYRSVSNITMQGLHRACACLIMTIHKFLAGQLNFVMFRKNFILHDRVVISWFYSQPQRRYCSEYEREVCVKSTIELYYFHLEYILWWKFAWILVLKRISQTIFQYFLIKSIKVWKNSYRQLLSLIVSSWVYGTSRDKSLDAAKMFKKGRSSLMM